MESLLPSEADALIERGDEQSLRRALELEPARGDAAVPLARILLEQGNPDEALAIVSNVPGSFAADGLAARIGLERDGERTGIDLKPAFDAIDSGNVQQGLDRLLEALPLRMGRGGDPAGRGRGADGAREWTIRSPSYRRKLASALY